MSRERKIYNTLYKILDKLETLFFILVFLVGTYFTWDSVYVYYNSAAARVAAWKPVEASEEVLRDLSPDCIAWITIDNSPIDYPIMHYTDNIKYLNTDAYGDYNLSGAIFMDYRNTPDFSDSYSLVYGHHMSNHFLFGALDLWQDSEYFNNHLTGTLIVGNKTYDFNVFAFVHTDSNEAIIFNPIGSNPINYIRNNATNFVEPIDGNLVILSTCKSPTSTKRTIVCATIKLRNISDEDLIPDKA